MPKERLQQHSGRFIEKICRHIIDHVSRWLGPLPNGVVDYCSRCVANVCSVVEFGHEEQQPHRTQHEQHRSQQQPVQGRRVEKGKEKKEEEGNEMGKEGKKEKGKGKEERQDGKEGMQRGGGVEKVVEKDVMDGRSRNTRRRKSQGEGGVPEEKETSASAGRADQIFVKMDGFKTLPLDVSPNDKVGDILRWIQSSACDSKQDMYATCEGRVLMKDDEFKSGGVQDGSTVQVMRRMRGGGRHKEKKRKGSAKEERTEHRVDQKEEKVEGVAMGEAQKIEDNEENETRITRMLRERSKEYVQRLIKASVNWSKESLGVSDEIREGIRKNARKVLTRTSCGRRR